MRERRFQFFPNKLLQVDIPGPLCAPVTIHKRKVKLPAVAGSSQYVVFTGLLCQSVCLSRQFAEAETCVEFRAGAGGLGAGTPAPCSDSSPAQETSTIFMVNVL